MTDVASRRVLVVDDDPDNRRVLRRILMAGGATVAEAEDGTQALATLESFRPDLVVLDLTMPEIDGWETVRRIKRIPGFSATPIVALTAHALAGDEERARRAGCDGYIAKPCRPAELRERFRQWLG
jgi:two-component system cell cycle response regulator DivK